ncbi:MAG: cytochrome P450 [Gammaproteobacteria bacterium]
MSAIPQSPPAPPRPAGLARDGGELADIHSHLAWLRARHPVADMTLQDYFGVPRQVQFKDVHEFTVLGYDACKEAFVDAARFSSRGYAPMHDEKLGHPVILSMDEPEHRQHRDLVSAGFFTKGLDSWANRSIPAIIHELLDRLPPGGGSADFVRDFTYPLPIQVIVGLLGAPREDWPRLLPLVDLQINFGVYPEEGMKAALEIRRYIADIVAQRRREPRQDLASTLAAAEIGGERLTDTSIIAFLMVLLSAGGETTVRALGTLISALLRNPGQFEAVRNDRALVKPAIEEALRWDPPVTQLRRLVTRDTELGGTALPAGAHISINVTAANRDPARWPDPDRFDIFREEKSHLAFGAGPHYCIGVHLAKREIETAMNAFLDRVDSPRFAGEPAVVQGLALRGPRRMDLAFNAIRGRSA